MGLTQLMSVGRVLGQILAFQAYSGWPPSAPPKCKRSREPTSMRVRPFSVIMATALKGRLMPSAQQAQHAGVGVQHAQRRHARGGRGGWDVRSGGCSLCVHAAELFQCRKKRAHLCSGTS